MVFMDDGLGNLTELDTKHYQLRNLLSIYIFGVKFGFSKRRNFAPFVRHVVSIYDTELYIKPYGKNIITTNIKDQLTNYLSKINEFNKPSIELVWHISSERAGCLQ